MKKKKSIVIGLALLFVSFLSCDSEDQIDSLNSINGSSSLGKSVNQESQTSLITKEDIEAESCDDPINFPLMAGQHIEVGVIQVSNDENNVYVRYEITESEWWLTETHLFIGDIGSAPFTNSGNPQIGRFTYQSDHEFVHEFIYTHPIDGNYEEISIIAHGVVVQRDGDTATSNETAFGKGQTEFDGNRWGWIINYQPVECDDDGNNDGTGDDGSNDDDGNDDGTDNGSDDGTSNGTDGDTTIGGIGGTDGNTGSDSSSDNGCMDAYAYSNDIQSTCLLDEFGQWGWTNLVNENSQHYVPGGVNYSYPLYASAYQCDTSNSILIGEMRLNVQGGDGKLYAKVDIVLNNQDLSITDVNLYFGSSKYPLDERGQPTISSDAFDINLTGLNEKSFSATWIEWDPESYFIAHVKVCPEASLP
ncbi:hypothetical protein LCM02_04140 [Lutimonas saemankumensis]|uniref:hypothetical protein n=1 Tax=Lutimonas saemankumensis TaxID=483016 RepID=UPI001CD1C09C|nr:hypothetical protein [Lutimonas saemankumensis]MCA0931630.1 hypothetical protein [Lutimonas saemankumensis]